MNEDTGMLRGAMGGATGGLIVLLFLGFMRNMFWVRTGHDRACLIMFIFDFTLPLRLLGALVGTITGISVWLMARNRKRSPGLITLLLIGLS